MTDNKLIFTKVCNSEKNMNTIYDLVFSKALLNGKVYLLIGHGSPFYHKRLRKTLGSEVYIISIEDESFRYSWKCMEEDEDVFFINLNDVNQLKSKLIHILTKINMKKFDYIIMNPPYDGSLHLEIISKCLNYLSDNGQIVNLSPIRWLQDPLKGRDYKKYERIRNKIESLYPISAGQAQAMFGNVMNMDLGLYILTNRGGASLDFLIDSVCNKVIESNSIYTVFDNNKKDGWRVRISIIGGGKSNGSGIRKIGIQGQKLLAFFNGQKDNKYWYEYYQKNQYSKTTPEITYSLPFNSKEEAENFIFVMGSTKFGRYFYHRTVVDVHIHPYNFIKLDYTHPWTDEMLYKYFGLTDDEIKEIEETIK